MSEQLLKKLGLGPNDLQPLSTSKILTAKMGASLEILGELKTRVQLQLGGCETRFRCRPVVVRGLIHDLNLLDPSYGKTESISFTQGTHSGSMDRKYLS
jgi:hypothetical protein